MALETELSPWDRLGELASASNRAELEAYLATLKPSEVVTAVLRIGEESQ
jgi:hypothetical protein